MKSEKCSAVAPMTREAMKSGGSATMDVPGSSMTSMAAWFGGNGRICHTESAFLIASSSPSNGQLTDSQSRTKAMLVRSFLLLLVLIASAPTLANAQEPKAWQAG